MNDGATSAYVAKNDIQRAADLGALAAAAGAPTIAVSDEAVDIPLDPAVFHSPFGADGLSLTRDLHLDCPAWPPPGTLVADTTTTTEAQETTTTEAPSTTVAPSQDGSCSELDYHPLFASGDWAKAGCDWARRQLENGRSKATVAFRAAGPVCDDDWRWENRVVEALAECADPVIIEECADVLASSLGLTLPAIDDPALDATLNLASALAAETTAGSKRC